MVIKIVLNHLCSWVWYTRFAIKHDTCRRYSPSILWRKWLLSI